MSCRLKLLCWLEVNLWDCLAFAFAASDSLAYVSAASSASLKDQ